MCVCLLKHIYSSVFTCGQELYATIVKYNWEFLGSGGWVWKLRCFGENPPFPSRYLELITDGSDKSLLISSVLIWNSLDIFPELHQPCLVLMTCGDMLSAHSLSLFPLVLSLLCFLQGGYTPVLIAAYTGNHNVIDVLVERYKCSLSEVTNVSGV